MKDTLQGFPAVRGAVLAILVATAAAVNAGCVRRTMTFKTVPEGATVKLNDQDVGQTPLTVDFTWYGDYDICYEKEGYQTVRTHKKLNPPWYQLPVIDLFAEAFVPYTIHDQHVIEQELEPQKLPTQEELLPRAREFRDEALFGQD